MTRRWEKAAIGAVLAFVGLVGAGQAAKAASLPVSTYAAIGPRTSVPYGWVDFCNRYAAECDEPALEAQDVELTSRVFAQVDRINRQINAAIEAVTDKDHWGIVDRWDYPSDGKGDCEDFALLKRKKLMEAGFPRQALLITVVKDLEGDGHAILTLKTSRGEFVLDNLTDKVKAWTETGYRFVKRQSQENPNVWVSIGTPGEGPVATARP